MSYDREIAMFRKLAEKYNIQTLVFDPASPPEIDITLEKSVHLMELNSPTIRNLKHRTLYAIEDALLCKYNALLLPDTGEVLLVGPYLTREINSERLMELMENRSIPSALLPVLKRYYSSLSVVLMNEAIVLGLMSTIAEAVWGEGTPYEQIYLIEGALINSVDVANQEMLNRTVTEADLRLVEDRYAAESQLIHTVSKGQTHQAELIISHISQHVLEPRTVDPVRNIKNYGIICNTLMRKAAQEGGVHPLHIDKLSSDMARRLEAVRFAEEGLTLFRTMVHKYCLLVRNHSMNQYSQLVQHVILRIESDLTADLSLAAHAASLNVNPSYLSTLFKRETGMTLTDYVNRQRVEHGVFLLNATDMQVQTIAQYCGIQDVNYFTKTFKKIIGCTPKEYRQNTRQVSRPVSVRPE